MPGLSLKPPCKTPHLYWRSPHHLNQLQKLSEHPLKSCLCLFGPLRAAFKARFVPVISVVDSDALLPLGRRSVQSPIWFQRVPSGPGVRPVGRTPDVRRCTAHALLPAGREPENIPCQTGFIQRGMTWGSRRLAATRPTSRRLPAGSNHHKLCLGPLPPRRAGGETRRAHSVLLDRGSRPLRGFTSGLPGIPFLGRPQTRAAS